VVGESAFCSSCGSPSLGQPFCSKCGRNLAGQRPTPAQAPRPPAPDVWDRVFVAARTWASSESGRRWLPRIAIVVALLVALAVIVLPRGPDIPGETLEQSFAGVIKKGAPPASDESGIKSLDCGHSLLTTRTWSCDLEQDISLLPDSSATYEVDIKQDNCWTARLNESKSDSEAGLIGARWDGCIR